MANQYSSMMPWDPEDIEERRRLVVKERVRGTPYAKIKELVGAQFGRTVSEQMLNADFKIEMKRRRDELNEDLDEVRNTMIQRLDNLLAASFDRAEAGSVDHQEIVLKIEARRAKLLGTDAPERRETTVSEVPRLTPEQILIKMAEISARLAARKGRAGLPEPKKIIDVGEKRSVLQEIPLTNTEK